MNCHSNDLLYATYQTFRKQWKTDVLMLPLSSQEVFHLKNDENNKT